MPRHRTKKIRTSLGPKYLAQPHASVTRGELAVVVQNVMRQNQEQITEEVARRTLIGLAARVMAYLHGRVQDWLKRKAEQ